MSEAVEGVFIEIGEFFCACEHGFLVGNKDGLPLLDGEGIVGISRILLEGDGERTRLNSEITVGIRYEGLWDLDGFDERAIELLPIDDDAEFIDELLESLWAECLQLFCELQIDGLPVRISCAISNFRRRDVPPSNGGAVVDGLLEGSERVSSVISNAVGIVIGNDECFISA